MAYFSARCLLQSQLSHSHKLLSTTATTYGPKTSETMAGKVAVISGGTLG